MSGDLKTDLDISSGVIGVSGLIYSIVVGIYVTFVIYGLQLYYGYENIERLPYAIFVDRRYNFFWFIYLFQVSRVIIYFLYMWSANKSTYSYWVYTIHKALNRIYIFLDVIFLLILLFLGWVHNSSWFPENPCNDKKYCASFGNQWTTLCKTESYTAYDPKLLYSNQACTADFWLTCIFLIFDIIMLINAKSHHLTYVRYKEFEAKN